MAVNQKNIIQMQLIKFDLFKSQDPETGRYDTVFDVGGKIIFAHKNMLNMVSQTFDAMLSERWNANKDEPIKITDYSYDDFYQFLTFLYSGQCQLTDSNIATMVDMAEFYGVGIFKNYCDQYLSSMEITTKNIFQLMDLANKYSMVQLKSSINGYFTQNFQVFAGSDGFLNASKSVIQEIFTSVKDNVKHENLFQAVYKWAEKQAIDKQTVNPNHNLQETIKNEISDFLPHIAFVKINLHFLHEFVVSRGFIFSSRNEVSKLLCNRHPKTEVKVTNKNGQILRGSLIPDNTFIEIIKSLNGRNSSRYGMSCYWNVPRLQLSVPSPIKKSDGIEWYLTYSTSIHQSIFSFGGGGYIHVRRRLDIQTDDYLLAEMFPELSQFHATFFSKIEME